MDGNRPGGRSERQPRPAQYGAQAHGASSPDPDVSEPPELTQAEEYGMPPRTAWTANPFRGETGQHALDYSYMPPSQTSFVDSDYVRQVPADPGAPAQYSFPGLQNPSRAVEQTLQHHSTMMYGSEQTGEPAYATQPTYVSLRDPGLFPVGSNEYTLYQTYEEQLRRANTSIVQGQLLTASEHVLEASELLLRNVVVLGLTYDDPVTYDQRLKLFRDFNRCWLALAQKQIDQLNELVDAGQTVLPPNVLDDDTIQHMGNMLIQLCDPIAKEGLVDYEMGVEEERILDTLVICRDLIKKVEDPTQDHESAGRPDSWSSAGSRGSRVS